jgi:hypothetical protein
MWFEKVERTLRDWYRADQATFILAAALTPLAVAALVVGILVWNPWLPIFAFLVIPVWGARASRGKSK